MSASDEFMGWFREGLVKLVPWCLFAFLVITYWRCTA